MKSAGASAEYICHLEENDSLVFDSLDELLAYSRDRQLRINALRVSHEVDEFAGVSVFYGDDGEVVLSAYGRAPDFEFNVDRVSDELARLDEAYPWRVRNVLLRRLPIRIL